MEDRTTGRAGLVGSLDRRRAAGVLLVIVSAGSFGSGALFAKGVYPTGMDWLGLLAWRFLIGAALSWAWLLLVPANRDALGRLSPRRALVLLGLGAFFVLNASPYFMALETVPASLAALIIYIYPVLVAVLSVRFGRGFQGRRPWLALGLAFGGIVLALGGIPATTAPPVQGIALAVLSPVIYSFYIVMTARVAGERPGQTAAESADPVAQRQAAAAPAAALMLTATWAVTFLMALAAGRPVLPDQVPAAAWPGLIGIGVISTAIAIQAFYAGTARLGAAQAALISTIEPVFTIALASLLLAERLTAIQVVGGALVIAAVLIAQSTPGTAAPAVREE